MSRARRLRRQQRQTAAAEAKATAQARLSAAQPPVLRAPLWLAAAFLLPNLGALACGFVFDDRVLIVENESLHVQSLGQLAHIWKSGYWPDNRGLELYRPVSQTVWALTLGRGRRLPPGAVSCHRPGAGFGGRAAPLPLLARRRNAAAHRVHCRIAVRAFPDPHRRHYVGGRLGGTDGRGLRSGRADFLLSRPADSRR